MDKIRLRDLAVECVLGDLPEERAAKQTVYVDLDLELDLQDAAESDTIGDTVDYAILVGNVRETLEEAKCRLLERAANLVADVCLADARVLRARVVVRKLASVPGLGSAEVEIERGGFG